MTQQPNFIGIGVQKGGTSWLHKQMVEHPEIFVPKHRKEIHFFDVYYDRPHQWYLNFFQAAEAKHKAIGEISPDYIYHTDSAKRMRALYPDIKLIIILRHPVQRAYSHYRMTFQSGEGQKYQDFDDFMARHPHSYKRGLYAQQLKIWMEHFNRDQMLIMTYDEMFEQENGVEQSFDQIAQFLDIDAGLFDRTLAYKRVGQARGAPKYPMIAKIAQSGRILLRDLNLDFMATVLTKMGLTRQLFGQREQEIPPLLPEIEAKWMQHYQNEIADLEQLLGRSFNQWL